ncbi:hypothetical protein QL285_058559 [Trifolium repens]|nr:hypothetical protein QL285_058559 [Trifolium repens]
MARRRRKVKKRVCAIPRAPNGSAFFNWYEKQPFVSRARELDNKHQEALKQEADEIIKVRYGADSPMIDEMQWIFGESLEFSK